MSAATLSRDELVDALAREGQIASAGSRALIALAADQASSAILRRDLVPGLDEIVGWERAGEIAAMARDGLSAAAAKRVIPVLVRVDPDGAAAVTLLDDELEKERITVDLTLEDA